MLGEVVPYRTDIRGDLKVGNPLSSSPIPTPASSRPDEEGDAGATRRASATRSHEPSRGTLSGFSTSLSPARRALSRVAPKRASFFLHLHVHYHLRQHTLPPLLHRRLFSLRTLVRSHERLVPTDVRSHTQTTERSHARARGTHTRARVDRVCPRVERTAAGHERPGDENVDGG